MEDHEVEINSAAALDPTHDGKAWLAAQPRVRFEPHLWGELRLQIEPRPRTPESWARTQAALAHARQRSLRLATLNLPPSDASVDLGNERR